jgi:hypothetical protein
VTAGGRVRARWLAMFAAALGMTVFGVAAPSAIAGKKIKTRIEIRSLKTTGAAGTLSSRSDPCLKQRKVSLFTWDGMSSQKVAITNSGSDGDWKINRDLNPGTRYFAKVDAKGKCGYDVSPFKNLR